ncbi:hypothetical protein CLI64_23240 [Nostoc sp. CENA543]|uniref:hypothetical protein n=1 Tax=Nostoc sp. CENA543 TaxID=1869241 RepID=UPI000CA38ED8|nr:hypothetical protein [Nostoc sp. CENA543]AUT03085.1 hypothetical protein CLI64_23240 [Nostoc sp. CENA543]
MKKLYEIGILSGIVGALVVMGTIAMTTSAQSQPAQQPLSTANVQLNVQRTSGNCPETVGLWWIILPYEGGAEHTVVADTRLFADTTKLVPSNNQHFVEFVSNLNSQYANCVGKTISEEYVFYNIEFKNEKAYFRVDLRKINPPGKLIVYKTVAAFRPYVRWAIAD